MRMNQLLRCAALLLSLAWVQAAPAAWQTLGRVVHEQRDKAAIELITSSGAHVRVSFADADVMRVRVSPTGTFERDFSYALADAPRDVPMDVQNKGGRIVLRAAPDGSRVEITQAPELLVDVYDAAGNLVVGDDPARPIAFDAATGAIETSKQRVPAELYYGFGEKALPLSRHQQYMTMWNSDTPGYAPGLDPIYQTIPFFIATSLVTTDAPLIDCNTRWKVNGLVVVSRR